MLVYAINLCFIFLLGLVVQKITEKFKGTISLENSVQYIAYVATPGLLGGILNLFNNVLFQAITLCIGVYGLYLFYSAIEKMTGLDSSAKLKFAATTFVSALLIGIVLGITFAAFAAGGTLVAM